MASALEELEECVVCKLPYVDPQLLTCSHTVCKQCVSHMLAGTHLLTCPICRAVSPADHIRADFRLSSIQQALAELRAQLSPRAEEAPPPDQQCELCQQRHVLCWCRECAQRLCGTCRSLHVRSTCSQHHTLVDLDQELEAVKQVLESKKTLLQAKMAQYGALLEQLGSRLQRVGVVRQRAHTEARHLRRQLHEQVDEALEQVDFSINYLADVQTWELEDDVSALNSAIQAMQQQLQLLDHSQQGTAQLLSNQQQLQVSCDQLIDSQCPVKMARHRFLTLSVDLNESFNITNAVQLSHEYRDTEVTQAPVSLRRDRQWAQRGSVSLDVAPYCLRLVAGEALCVGHTQGLLGYSHKLVKLAEYTRQWGMVSDVTQLPDGRLLIAAFDGLYACAIADMQKDDFDPQRLYAGYFTSVLCHQGRVYAARSDPGTLYILNEQRLQEHESVPMASARGRYSSTALCVAGAQLFVAHVHHSAIDVLTLGGQAVTSLTRQGYKQPVVCAADSEGSVLVAYSDTHSEPNHGRTHLFLYDTAGSWQDIHLKPAPGSVASALIHGDKLYVCTAFPPRILLYERSNGNVFQQSTSFLRKLFSK